MGSKAWRIYKDQNLSIETWQKMWQLKIFDYDDYLRISPWVELDWNQTLQLIPGIENNSNSWARAIHQRKIDSVIESAENLGWTPELIGGAIELSEKFNIDLETVEQMGISNIQLAINSLKYCRKKGLEVNADNLPWFEKHNWKIPKLKKGFASYVGVDIFDQLSNVKSNYIHLNDLIVMFNNSDAPKLHLIFSMPNQRIQRIQTEINALRPRGHPNHHQAVS